MQPIYLASPYSHPNRQVMIDRYTQVCRKAGELIEAGVPVFAPIAHNAGIIHITGMPNGWTHWQQQDHALLRACKRLVVLRLPGWEQSEGVKHEIEIARDCGYPIDYLDMSTDVEAWKRFLMI